MAPSLPAMIQGEVVFRVARPPAEAWTVLADLERAPEWVPDLIEVTKLTPGEVGVGTRYHEIVEMSGNRTEAELEVTTFDPPRTFAHAGQGGPASFSATFTLEPDEGGTKVTHAYTCQMKGMMKFMEPILRGWITKNSANASEALAGLIEGGASE